MLISQTDWLLIIPRLGCGGTERSVILMAEELIRRGQSTTLVSFAPPTDARRSFFELGSIKHIELKDEGGSQGVLSALKNNFNRVRRIRGVVRDEKPRMVVSFLPQMNILTLIATSKLQSKVIVSERNKLFARSEHQFWRLARRILYPRAHRVTGNSVEIVEQLSHILKSKNVHLVRNMLAARNVKPAVTHHEREQIILNVGRLVPQKNHELLIKSFAQSVAFKKGWILALVGEGSEKSRLRKLTMMLGIERAVRFVGESRSVDCWYNRADMFVLTSNFEGTPNAVLEAMYFGLPVICTDSCGGVNELIETGRDGYVVPAFPSIVTRYIDMLVEDRCSRLRLGECATRTIEKFYSKEAITDWLDLTRQ